MSMKAYIHDGTVQFVFPEGYEESSLVDIPEGMNISRGWYIWDGTQIVDDLPNWRLWVQQEANNRREIELYLPCETPIGTIDATPQSRQILYTIKFATMMDPIYTVELTLNNNTTMTCNNSDIDSVLLALRERDDFIHSKYKNIKDTANISDSIIENIL
jgi:hypothetical protein